MTSVTPIIAAGPSVPANTYPKHPPVTEPAPKQPPAEFALKQTPHATAVTPAAEHRHAAPAAASTALSAQALSSTDVSYVESLMGAIPAQKMEEILLKTGVPIPANLGPNIDTSA